MSICTLEGALKKLRLLLFEKCNRACPGCCNKGFDLSGLPVCESLEGWDEVSLTGGEPMLDPQLVIDTAFSVPTPTPVNLYTAKVDDLPAVINVLHFLNGLCVTLHDQRDVEPFLRLNDRLVRVYPKDRWSLRLNVFKGVNLPPETDLSFWKVKDRIEWIPDCPLPEGETFMRLA